jgi:beta-lactam-binding protein with PASTA domain
VLIPNFQGVSLTSARSLASTDSLELEFSGSGRGWVISQEPAPGTIVGGDQRTVVVNFSARRGDG